MNKVSFLAIFLALFVGFSADAYATNNGNGPPDNRPPDNRPPDKGCKKDCPEGGGDIDIDIDIKDDTNVVVIDKDDIDVNVDTDLTVEGDNIDVTATGGTGIGHGGDATATATGGAGGEGGNAVIEEGAIENTNINENNNENNLSTESNSESNSSSTSDSTSSASIGDVNVYNVHNAAKRIAGTMHIGGPDSPTSILYNATADAAEKGSYVRQEYIEACGERHTRRNPIRTRTWERSDVRVQFTNHQNFTKSKRMGLDVPVTLVQPHEDGGVINAKCLGLALVDSVEKKESLSMGKVESGFYHFVTSYLGQCSSEIYLYSMEETLAHNRGVDTRSGAWNALSTITNIIDDGTGGLGGGANVGRSGAFGRVQLGNTYWVLCDDPNGKSFDFGIPVEEKVTPVITEVDPPFIAKKDVATPPEEQIVEKTQRAPTHQPNKVNPFKD